MISLQTNLSSIITQNNLNLSTSKLNQAIERMSTGYKINHAGDNAASYSIATNMSTQISACDIAADNIAMGMDLVNVAQDTIAGMQDRASRIHALITQARNGTYGATSLTAMTQEAQAIASEISRLYNNTEYNGIKLFEVPLPEWAKTVQASAGVNAGTTEDVVQAQNGGFIAEVVEDTPQVTVTDPTQLASAISGNTKIGIGNAETLAKLAELVNSGTNCSGKTIILTEDIDLSAYQEGEGWTPIGNSSSKKFQGTFNGNGHKVTGLYINRPTSDYQGLFGYATGELKNIAVIDADVTGKSYTGGLAGDARGAITNSYSTGNVTGSGENTGGLAGYAQGAITNSYSTGNVTGSGYCTGGLAGETYGDITNSYSTGNVTGSGDRTGGLAGYAIGAITNSYSTGNVTGSGNYTGGLAGQTMGAITNSYSTGNVTGSTQTGGLAGFAMGAITNSYSTGNVTGANETGGLAGRAVGAITNSYSTGNVTGISTTGGLGGRAGAITNSYSTGNVTGTGQYTGGLAGNAQGAITNSYSTGNVTGTGQYTGGLAGNAGAITNSYSTGNVTGTEWVGGLVGQLSKTSGTLTYENILSSGTVSGNSKVGNLIGGIVNTSNGTSYSTITITNASARQGDVMIGFEGKFDGTAYESGQMEGWLENITAMRLDTTLQVGTYGDSNSQISVDTRMGLNLSISDLTSDGAYNSITAFLNQLSEKSTQLGSAQNRLESALESNLVKMDNLTSSLSTIRDADIGKVSSDYIRQQILQQACATLMSTANQSPSIALQLL